MNKYILICISCLLTFELVGQQPVRVQDRVFNFGGTVGLRSSLPAIKSLTIDGIEAENIQMHYRVGYMASLFCRINMGHLFFQPSLSWQHSSGEIRFNIPTELDPSTPITEYDVLKLTMESVELPVLLGYKIIKEGPYGLSLMVGPKLRYNYKTDYRLDFDRSLNRFDVESNHFDVNIVTGLGVIISRLFIDFTYEFGLNRLESDFRNLNPSEAVITDIELHKRINVMSFSLGFLF